MGKSKEQPFIICLYIRELKQWGNKSVSPSIFIKLSYIGIDTQYVKLYCSKMHKWIKFKINNVVYMIRPPKNYSVNFSTVNSEWQQDIQILLLNDGFWSCPCLRIVKVAATAKVHSFPTKTGRTQSTGHKFRILNSWNKKSRLRCRILCSL